MLYTVDAGFLLSAPVFDGAVDACLGPFAVGTRPPCGSLPAAATTLLLKALIWFLRYDMTGVGENNEPNRVRGRAIWGKSDSATRKRKIKKEKETRGMNRGRDDVEEKWLSSPEALLLKFDAKSEKCRGSAREMGSTNNITVLRRVRANFAQIRKFGQFPLDFRFQG